MFQTTISKLYRNYDVTDTNEKIIFRLINIDNIYFFAEEIVTGAIFPIYCLTECKSNYDVSLNIFSYLESGKYFIYFPIEESTDEVLKYGYDLKEVKEDEDNNLYLPDEYEVQTYINDKKDSFFWQRKMAKLEQANQYYCDLMTLKDVIATHKKNNTATEYDFETKSTVLDLSPIKEYGYDLSKKKDLCNLKGRTEEIKKIVKVLCIKEKSAILIGKPGSGKTAIIEGLARNINNIPWLKGKTIFSLNTSLIVSGTQYTGTFEKKLNDLIKFCVNNRSKIILFIDEIHTLYGLGRTIDSSLDAMNILKPYIESGQIILIGTTTEYEYEKFMLRDSAFVRRLERINIMPPSDILNSEILSSYIKELEIKYNIKFDIEDYKINSLVQSILEVTDEKNQKLVDDIKMEKITLAKQIIENAFIEAVYNMSSKITLDDICLSIVNCDRIGSISRKNVAKGLKEKLLMQDAQEKIVEMPSISLKRVNS